MPMRGCDTQLTRWPASGAIPTNGSFTIRRLMNLQTNVALNFANHASYSIRMVMSTDAVRFVRTRERISRFTVT